MIALYLVSALFYLFLALLFLRERVRNMILREQIRRLLEMKAELGKIQEQIKTIGPNSIFKSDGKGRVDFGDITIEEIDAFFERFPQDQSQVYNEQTKLLNEANKTFEHYANADTDKDGNP
jgi:hypothetical protein